MIGSFLPLNAERKGMGKQKYIDFYEIIKSIFHSQQNQELFLLEGPLIKMMNALINILKKPLAMQ